MWLELIYIYKGLSGYTVENVGGGGGTGHREPSQKPLQSPGERWW